MISPSPILNKGDGHWPHTGGLVTKKGDCFLVKTVTFNIHRWRANAHHLSVLNSDGRNARHFREMMTVTIGLFLHSVGRYGSKFPHPPAGRTLGLSCSYQFNILILMSNIFTIHLQEIFTRLMRATQIVRVILHHTRVRSTMLSSSTMAPLSEVSKKPLIMHMRC